MARIVFKRPWAAVFGGLLFFSLLLLHGEENLHKAWAIKDCRIVSRGGVTVEKGIVLIRDGLIEGVGASVSIPASAEVIDGSKLTVYPGFIDALNQSLLKFPEEKFDPSKVYTGQFTDKDKGITPELGAFDYFQIGKADLEKYHKSGLTAVQVLPQKGILTGQSAFFSLSDPDKNVALILKDNLLGVGFSPAGFLVYPNSLMGVVAFIRQEFSDSAYFKMHQGRWFSEMRGISRPIYNSRHEILSRYVSGNKPVVFLCRNQHDIRRALELSREFKLDFFICDQGNESFQVIPELKEAKARVLCAVDFKVPSTSIHAQKGKEEKERAEKEIYVKNPTRMAEAGIPFAFTSLGTDDPKSFSEGIQKAVENGLPADWALEALTSVPAKFFGLDKALGSVEPGKIANLVLLEGEIFSKEAKVRHVFADGRKFELKEAKLKEGEKPEVNVSGRWEISIEGAGLTLTVDFSQEEAFLTGKMTTPFGIFDITEGSVSGKEIYFEMIISVGGQDIDLYFTAHVDGDRMTGTVIQGTEGSTEFTGKRVPF